MPHDDDADEIWTKVLALAGECQGESNAFTAVRPFVDADPSRPLYVLVHPGDVVQTRSDAAYSDDPRAITEYSFECQESMALEIEAAIEKGWDVAVLHRFSSSYGFGTGNTSDLFEDAIDAIHGDGAILFGDALADASDWLLSEGRAADRPAVVVSGAWSETETGCVAAVGERLEAGGASVRLGNSACVSPDGSGKEWEAKAGRIDNRGIKALYEPPVPFAP